jgi:hypothetical protein
MVETTGLRRLGAPTWLLIAAILGPASALHAQASEADTEVDPATGFPSGYWVEFGDGEDWMRLTSGEWLRGNLNWMRDGDFEHTRRSPGRQMSKPRASLVGRSPTR